MDCGVGLAGRESMILGFIGSASLASLTSTNSTSIVIHRRFAKLKHVNVENGGLWFNPGILYAQAE